MAKLSAHGRELLRVSKTEPREVQDSGFEWIRHTFTIHADGMSLSKMDGREVGRYGPPRIHSWGWKVRGKVKPEAMADIRGLAARYEAKGWTVEYCQPPVFGN